jgi:circadian clock protein KaiB
VLKPKPQLHAGKALAEKEASLSGTKYFLRLYVAGTTVRSRQALRRVYQLCEAELKEGNYEVELIDVYQQPELARKNQIVATPTLIKVSPLPVQRFVGNMETTKRLFDEGL